MKKIIRWLNANKYTLSGLASLILFLLDELFNCIGFKQLPEGMYYVILFTLFIVIGIAIPGRGLETIDQFDEIMKNKEKFKTIKSIKGFIVLLFNILFKKEPTSIESNHEQTTNETIKTIKYEETKTVNEVTYEETIHTNESSPNKDEQENNTT